jgi:hypothetical protein
LRGKQMVEITYRDIAIKHPELNMRIVAMIPTGGGFIIATEFNIFTLKDGVFEPMKTVEADANG